MLFKFLREQLSQDVTHEKLEMDGMTIVDAYYIQDDQVELYKKTVKDIVMH